MLDSVAHRNAPPALLVTSTLPQRAVTPPDEVVRSVIQSIVNVAQYDADIQAGDEDRMVQLIEDKVAPYLDFERMTSLAAGRVWSAATPSERKQLVREFHRLVIYTFSSVMMGYRTSTTSYLPLRMNPGDTDVTVRLLVNQSGKNPIPIDLSMGLTPRGWRGYDVVVAGVSIVTNYREEWRNEAGRTGVAGVIAKLAKQNSELERKVGRTHRSHADSKSKIHDLK